MAAFCDRTREALVSIRIESAEEFKQLLENLALELVDANIYLRLHFDLGDATRDYRREFRQPNCYRRKDRFSTWPGRDCRRSMGPISIA